MFDATLYTIGFAQKTAERFFRLIEDNHITMVVDIRLRPGGQLAGFAKQDDLCYFLDRLTHCSYIHRPDLAPTSEVLDDYRKDHDWVRYAQRFEALMDERGVPDESIGQLIQSEDVLSALQRADE